jgi:quercetin dioxygenase-like cupin family protein
MRIASSLLLTTFIGCIGFAFVASANAMSEHGVVPVDEVKWVSGPASLPPGSEAAVLYGDPGKEGLFTLRLKLPAGYAIAPHSHPKPEIVTIISGTFKLGHGDTADESQTVALPAGSFFAFEPGMTHFVFTDEETVVQLNSMGPWGVEYVNPADDPRQN